MSANEPISTFRRAPYSRRRERRDSPRRSETDSNIQSIGDTPFVHDLVQQILVQRSPAIHYNDYLYMIYLFLLAIFYTCYITVILQGSVSLFDENEQYYYWDNYERELPRLLWFSKGYRFR